MPIPLIIWGAVTIAATVAGAANTASAVGRITSAENRYQERRKRYENCLQTCAERRTHAHHRTESLGRTRLQATVTLGEAVKFLERARCKDRDLFERLSLTDQTMLEWKTASVKAEEIISGMAGAAASGIAASAAAYGLVGTLAAASTGTAISTLSGAAATNATLAWLGGGTLAAGGGGVAAGACVLGGVLVAPALLCASFVMHDQAEKVETQTARHIAELDENEAQQGRLCEETNTMIARINELEESTRDLESELKEILADSSSSREEDAYRVAKVAFTLGQLLDQSILPKSQTHA